MTAPISRLEELIELRRLEREAEQLAHTQEMAGKVDAALGLRTVAAMEAEPGMPWEFNHTTATRRFPFRGGEFHLVVTAIQGVNRVEVELRHVDSRFAFIAKKAGLGEVDEDWFLNAIETLAIQISERLRNPRNFA
jgi:hypothetical protein